MLRTVIVNNNSRSLKSRIRARYCNTFVSRLRGLMFRRRLDHEEGILLVQEKESRIDSAIHMLAVFTDLAVFWIDSDGVVVDKVIARAWQLMYIPRVDSRYVLEIHPDRLKDFEIGEKVEFVED